VHGQMCTSTGRHLRPSEVPGAYISTPRQDMAAPTTIPYSTCYTAPEVPTGSG
jgi:hypothetical protein